MDTSWISQIDNENFLGVYDVLLDIKKETNISPDEVMIPLMPQIIRFPALFPADSIGMRDRYCEIRWKAVRFLKAKNIVFDFKLLEGAHRWQSTIGVAADPKIVAAALSQMDTEYENRAPSASSEPAETSVQQNPVRVFIGHGRSSLWRDLKDFLSERLNLEWEEFNRESAAGLSTVERLSSMLDKASFAFLVMTAEDERADGTKHARDNVIHELGLFQGRLGFKRAIVLLEEGCAEFSNIHGLTQIRFPPHNILAVSEAVRRVLEREGIA